MGIKLIAPNKWRVDVRIWHDGQEFRERKTIEGGKKEAAAQAYEIKKELRRKAEAGRSLKSMDSFQNIIDYYLERVEIDSDSKTYLIKLREDLGSVSISQLRDRFDTYMVCLRKTKGRHTGRLLSNQTINHYLKWARAALNLAMRQGHIEKNPLEHFQKLPTIPRDRMLSDSEKAALVATVEREAPHLLPIVQYALFVPCRKGELVSLRREDYDMVNNVIRIPAPETKTKRPCIKPVPDFLTEYFRSIPAVCPYLFYRKTKKGEYLSLGDFRKSLNRCMELAGVKNWRFHDSRRGAYTDLLLAGNAPHTVMQISGHATDMSRVYFGRNELLAAQSARFKNQSSAEICDKTGHPDRTLQAEAL